MTMRAPRFELRSGARVRWDPAHSPESRSGKLIRPSPNGEEWLVQSDTGQRFWISVLRLRPPESGTP